MSSQPTEEIEYYYSWIPEWLNTYIETDNLILILYSLRNLPTDIKIEIILHIIVTLELMRLEEIEIRFL